MAEHSNSQELENNSWVITEAEAAPVEDLGFEASEETQLEASPPPESELFVDSPDLEEDKAKSQETEDNLISRDPSSQEPTLLLLDEKKTDGPNPEEESSPLSQSPPTGPPEGELQVSSSLGEEAVPSEADVEGLRRRKGRADVHQVGPELTRDEAKEAPEDENDGLSRAKWLLAVLAVVGFGVLATLGLFLDTEDGGFDMLNLGLSSDGGEPYPANGGQDWSPSRDSTKDAELHAGRENLSRHPKSLDAMGILLDKLAKENQDIRLMQAELQAQKEELETLLQKSQDETSAADSLQQNLAAENQRLAEALKKETAALSAARGELQLLREKVRRLDTPGDARSRHPPGQDPASRRPPGKLDFQDKELGRLRSLLGSVRQELGKLMQTAPLEELKNLEQRLGKELDLREAEKEPRMPWKETGKAKQGRGKPWQKKHQGEEKVRHQDGGDPKAASEKGPHHSKKHQTKPPKAGDPQRGPRKARKPADPQELWDTLAKHPFSAPQGCSGVAECAHREGLAPVQRSPFLKLVQNYLSGVGWERYTGDLFPVLEGFFGSDGVFPHDRIGFADFLDKTEDALEELARSLGVSEDGVDDFEDAILKQLEAAPGRRSTRGDGGAKERSHPKNRAYG